MRRTHAAAGLLIGFGLGAFFQTPLPETLVIALVSETAALIPDLDLKLKIKHRTLTHSLLALVVIGIIPFYAPGGLIQKEYSGLMIGWIAGYASHLILDMLTIQGIELLYPNHRRIRLLKLRTAGFVDQGLCVILLCGAVYALGLGLLL